MWFVYGFLLILKALLIVLSEIIHILRNLHQKKKFLGIGFIYIHSSLW